MKRIFVAIDSSPRAATVLAAAARMAELADASLVVFRAVGIPPDMPREILEISDQSLEDILRRNASADLERQAQALPSGRVERIITEISTAWDGIVRTAKEVDADLIVIGSHGYGGLDRLLGTTAAKVVNHADRNVLVVRTAV
ncbi:MAG TPA: universal stress protein [Kofleriaceae bacterium]|nr:universal stress protein [Kofleriaceae bacterium]